MNSNVWFEAKQVSAFKKNYLVIRNLTIKFRKKENIVILGPNGSGKSSIIELINRNIYPIKKENSLLKIFDQELINLWDLRKKINTVNSEIKSRISDDILVFDIVLSGIYGKYSRVKSSKKDDLISVKKLIKFMDIKHISQLKFGVLSEGEKQIVLIARALINKPEILILDEPSVNLDIKSKLFLISKIEDLTKLGTNVILVTHDINLITRNFNRIIFLKNMEIIADGIPSKIMKSDNINKLFDIDIELIKYKGNWLIAKK